MKYVYKYAVDVSDGVTVHMPRGAKVLSVGSQSTGQVCFWALVDPGKPPEAREFFVRGTGHPVGPEVGKFIGTVIDGRLVWHIFDARVKP